MKKTGEINRAFLDKVIKIREEKTGLNQEDFCEKYLMRHIPNELNSGSSKQNYMTRLEHGRIPFPVEFLPVYAKLGRCSIEELLDGNPHEYNSSIVDDLTYSDALHTLDALISNYQVSVETDRVKSANHEYHLNRVIITLLDGNLDSLLSEYMHLRSAASNMDDEAARMFLDLYIDKIAKSEEGKRPLIASKPA